MKNQNGNGSLQQLARRPKRRSRACPTRSAAPLAARIAAFRRGASIVEKVSGRVGQITADLTDDLTYEPGSYECDLGHGYLVVRHRSEIEERLRAASAALTDAGGKERKESRG